MLTPEQTKFLDMAQIDIDNALRYIREGKEFKLIRISLGAAKSHIAIVSKNLNPATLQPIKEAA